MEDCLLYHQLDASWLVAEREQGWGKRETKKEKKKRGYFISRGMMADLELEDQVIWFHVRWR